MKNALYFISKSFYFPKIFKFLSQLFGHVGKRLDKEIKKQIITINILPNISISKVNQRIRFNQLIAYSMRNIFLEE